MAGEPNGHFAVTWQTIIAGLTLVLVAWGATWTILQQQSAQHSEYAKAEFVAVYRQLDNNQKISADRDAALAKEITRINDELDARRSEFVNVVEFKQYEKAIAEQLKAISVRLDNLLARLVIVEQTQISVLSTRARDPVEKATVTAINDAIDKRVDLLQAQISEINRQIAAALIIIDNNSGLRVQRSGNGKLPP